jgi:hypothetical protein
MEDNSKSIFLTEWEELIPVIIRQTDYSEEDVRKYLIEYNGDHISVIKKYMGVEKKVEKPIKSINQEIYKQIRTQLDTSMKEYNALQEKKLEEEFMIKTTTE